MSPAFRQRLRETVPSGILAATIYLPLLLTRAGRVGADTKTYLYLDPARMLGRAPTMWDPNIGMGTVTHQNIGYLWPIGPWYWAADLAGLPDWVAQRLWLGTILFAAGVGVRFLLKALGQEGPHVTAATFCYALTPYVLTLGARLSVILLPYAGLPWLIGLTVLALRRGGWRYPALFGLVVATIGSVNATALILCGVAPVLWIVHEVVVTRQVPVRRALAVVGRIGVMTVGCSLWWLAGLWAQGGYGIEILRYTETAETVATASLSLEVLRGLGYWFFYGEDRFGPWIAPSRTYTTKVPVLALTYVIPGLGLLGAAFTRFRERAYFLFLLVVGLFLAVGAHPWDGGPPAATAVKGFLSSDVGLSMRSLPRAAPLVILSLSVFVGALVAAVTRERQRWARPMTAGVMVLAVLALPPLWRGQMVDVNLDRAEDLPEHYQELADELDERDDGTRVLEVPGADFASYRWGTTVDPVTPGLMDRPYVARELIPYGSSPSADLLNAIDHRFQERVADGEGLAPIFRFMGVGDVSVRSDLTYERYNTPRPRNLWDLLTHAPDLGAPIGFGGTARNVPRADLPLLDEEELTTSPDLADPPQVAIVPVEDAEKIIRTAPVDQPIILAGNGDGLVDAASAGLLTGHELVLYSASFAEDADGLARQLDEDAVLVVTDTNRRQARRWGTVRDTTGITEQAGQDPMREDPKDQRLDVFPDADDDAATVVDARGGVWAEATSYGNSVSLTPEDDPGNAVDSDLGTAWRAAGFSSAQDEALRLHYGQPVTTDRLRLLQSLSGVRNRSIAQVELRFDDGDPITVDLDASSRAQPQADTDPEEVGQEITFPEQTFSTLEITIVATDPGEQRRYDGMSSVGFTEVVVVDRDGARPVADDVVRLPTDLLDQAGDGSLEHPLAVVLTRQRVAGTVAVRSDPEPSLDRTFELPTDRSFTLRGQVRLSASAPLDSTLDAALGRPLVEEGGITATSKRRLPGGLTNGASSAIDGDPSTWYSPGFLDQHAEYVDLQLAEPATFDHLTLTVINDGRHSVPQRMNVFTGDDADELVAAFDLPAIPDQATPNGTHTFEVELPDTITAASRLRISIDEKLSAVRDVETLDWFTGKPVVMPVGIVELGIPGVQAAPIPEQLDDRCRDDLVTVDGAPVAVSLRGTTADLQAGKAIDLVSCDDLDLSAGTVDLATTPGATSGFDLDRLVLRSVAGGGADDATGPLVAAAEAEAARPAVTVDRESRVSADLTVEETDEPYWIVLGQSHNAGWHATADGEDLGEPTLVNGYANGWLVPAGATSIHLEWTPQKVVWAMIFTSLAFVVAALALVAWPAGRKLRRARAAGAPADPADDPTWVPLDARPSMPHALRPVRVLRYAGPTPSRFALVGTVVGSFLFGFAVIGTWSGILLALAAALGLRVARARPLLTLGGPLLFAGCVAVVLVKQQVQDLPSGFDWPTYFESVQTFAWTGVALLLLDAVIDRCWLRRWWPTDSSPT